MKNTKHTGMTYDYPSFGDGIRFELAHWGSTLLRCWREKHGIIVVSSRHHRHLSTRCNLEYL
jgi:hypothetical protein